MFSPNDAQVKYLYMDEVDAYGADIVRTCQFLSRHGKPTVESDFQETHEWFQRIWTIMLVTHTHCVTGHAPKWNKIFKRRIDTLDTAGMCFDQPINTWNIPETIPTRSKQHNSSDPCSRLFRASIHRTTRKAIQAFDPHAAWAVYFRTPAQYDRATAKFKFSLLQLTNALADHNLLGRGAPVGRATSVDHNLYGARILISLLAQTAPIFAEECWSVLRYGPRLMENGVEERVFTLGDAILGQVFPTKGEKILRAQKEGG